MAEWSKAHAWKVCMRQNCIVGSNPTFSAKIFVKHRKYCPTMIYCIKKPFQNWNGFFIMLLYYI